MTKKQTNMLFYISFATERKFIGGLYVEASSEIKAEKAAKDLGINPKAQAKVYQVQESAKVREGYMNRLLNLKEVKESIILEGH